MLERILVAIGVRPGLARFTSTTPSLRLGWLLANALVLLLVALPMALRPVATWPSAVLVAAPLVAAAAVAFAYGPAVDPAYEAVAATPLSPVRALLVRLAAVLVANTLLAGAVDLALDGRGPRAGWLLPMTAAALLAVLVASRWSPGVGAAAGMGAWLLILAGWRASQQPVAWLTGPRPGRLRRGDGGAAGAARPEDGPGGLDPVGRKRGGLRLPTPEAADSRGGVAATGDLSEILGTRSVCTGGTGGACWPSWRSPSPSPCRCRAPVPRRLLWWSFPWTLLCWSKRGLGFEESVELAGDVADQAASDFAVGLALSAASLGVGAGCWVIAQPGQHDQVQGLVELAVAGTVEANPDGLSGGRGDGGGAAQHGEGSICAAAARMRPGTEHVSGHDRAHPAAGEQVRSPGPHEGGDGLGVVGDFAVEELDAAGQSPQAGRGGGGLRIQVSPQP